MADREQAPGQNQRSAAIISSVIAAESRREPRHPSRLEKKKNMTGEYARTGADRVDGGSLGAVHSVMTGEAPLRARVCESAPATGGATAR